MGEKDVNTLMKRLKKYPYSDKPVKQKRRDQSNIGKYEEITDLLIKNMEWVKKSLTEKLDYYEKNINGNSEGYNSLIEGEIIAPILEVLPRYIDIEKWDYKNKELKIIFHKPEILKGWHGEVILKTSEPMFESDYNKLLNCYPCVKNAISNLEKKGIKVTYDRKNMRIGTKVV